MNANIEETSTTLKGMSIPTKINLVVGVIFLLVIVTVTGFVFIQDRARALEVAKERTTDMTTLYFDGLNTMMLTGTMANREILQGKMARRPGVLEARVIRGEPVKQQFGPGFDHEQPVDELDQRALKGEEIVQVAETSNGRVLTVLKPFKATNNTRGVNCLQCHNVPSGAINGATGHIMALQTVNAAGIIGRLEGLQNGQDAAVAGFGDLDDLFALQGALIQLVDGLFMIKAGAELLLHRLAADDTGLQHAGTPRHLAL